MKDKTISKKTFPLENYKCLLWNPHVSDNTCYPFESGEMALRQEGSTPFTSVSAQGHTENLKKTKPESSKFEISQECN